MFASNCYVFNVLINPDSQNYSSFSSIGYSIVILFMFCSGCALPYQEWSNYTDSTGNKESELVSLGSANLFMSKYVGKPKKLSVMWGSVLSWWDCPEVTEAEYSVSIKFYFPGFRSMIYLMKLQRTAHEFLLYCYTGPICSIVSMGLRKIQTYYIVTFKPTDSKLANSF